MSIEDSIILDVEVSVINVPVEEQPFKVSKQVRIKFVAMSGGYGPELTFDPSLVKLLHKKLSVVLPTLS